VTALGGAAEDEIEGLRAALVAFTHDHPAVVACAYLFGSAARGEAGPLSDLDIAVLFVEAVAVADRQELAARLADRLQRLDGPRVDVIVLEDAPPALVHRVIRDGRLLFCPDEARRVAFEARALREFLDFRPVLDRYDAALLARARESRLAH
jgi:predicted nucleotidyltransferase